MKIRAAVRRINPFHFLVGSVTALYVAWLLLIFFSSLSYVTFADFSGVFSSADLMFAMRQSLRTSVLAAFFALGTAIPTAYALNRLHFPGKDIVDTIVDTPIVLPPLVAGVMLLIFFQTPIGRLIESLGFRFVYEPAGIILAQYMVVTPYAVRTVKSAFDTIDKRLEDVARTLGWNQIQVFLRVTLPMVKNGIIAGGVISWALSMGLYGPMMVFTGTTRQRTEVWATSIFLELSIGRLGSALAISLLMLGFALVALILFKRLLGGKLGLW